MKNSAFFRRIAWILTCVLGLCAMPAWSQMGDQDAQHLSAEETQRLRQIVDAPIDPNALKSTQIPLFRTKNLAALQLNDYVSRERILREWLKVDPEESKWNLWNLLKTKGDDTEADQLGKELLSDIKYPSSRVRLLTQMAIFAMDRRQFKLAIESFDAAEKIIRYDFNNMRRFTGSDFAIARAKLEFLTAKSDYLRRIGKWSEGLENSRLAVAQGKEVLRYENTIQVQEWRDLGRIFVLRALIGLSGHQATAGLYSDAEWTLRDAYKLSRAHGFNEKMMSGFYNRAADLYNATGQYQDAITFSKRSEKLALETGFPKGSAPWLFSQLRLTQALAGQDQWPQALVNLEERDSAVKSLGTSQAIANPPTLRAYIYLKNKSHDEALKLTSQSLKSSIASLGEAHYFTASVRGLNAVALWRTGAADAARTEFEKSLQNFTAPESLTGSFIEDSFQLKTKRFILQSYLQLLAQTAASQPKDAELIFQIADQLNTSSVQQALSDAAIRSGVTIPGLSDIIRQEQDAKNEVTTLQAYISAQGTEDDKRRNPQVVEQMRLRVRELETQRKGYKAQIQKSYPEYFQLIQPKSPSHTDIAQQLKPDELFISVLPMEEKTYVWAIQAGGKMDFTVADLGEKQAHALVDRIRKTLDVAHLGDRAPAFDYASAHQLYQSLLLPFERELVGKKHLIVATSGALAKLPLAVLTRSPFSGADASQAPWLLRDLAVSHVPTANSWLSLKRLGQQPSGPQALMAWGDPLFDGKPVQVAAVAATPTEKTPVVRSVAVLRSADLTARHVMDPDTYVTYSKLSPLPETRDEVLELAKILGANAQQDVVLGAEATRSSVLKSSASGQLGKKQVVVFATHGLLAGDLPNLNQPALAMASNPNPADSPLLTLEDVLSLKLNADWVVLSACNTAGADGKAENALTGLARGFFFAGSRSLLVTHWSVESESAMMLTTHTFAAYKKDPTLRRSEALRQAMLETMKSKSYAHPTYWAPYALVGEGGR